MNSEILAGLSGIISNDLSVNLNSKKQVNSENNEFVSLLQNRLAFDISDTSNLSDSFKNSETKSQWNSSTNSVHSISARSQLSQSSRKEVESSYSKDDTRATTRTENSDRLEQHEKAETAEKAGKNDFRDTADEGDMADRHEDCKLSEESSASASHTTSQSSNVDSEAITEESVSADTDKETMLADIENVKSNITEPRIEESKEATASVEAVEETEDSEKLMVNMENAAQNNSQEFAAAMLADDTVDNTETQEMTKAQQAFEQLLATFSPEEKTALIEVLNRLSPKDLQILNESPGEFKNSLLKLLDAMPESDEKAAMMEMLDSPEFMQLLQAAANVHTTESTSSTSETTESGAESSQVKMQSVADRLQNRADLSSEKSDKTAETDVTDKAAPNDESAEAKTDLKTESADEAETKNNLKHERVSRQSSEKQGSTESKSGEENTVITSKESLREEFRRQNTASSEAASAEDQSSGDDAKALSGGNQQPWQPVVQTDSKSAAEDLARKFLSLFGEKNGTAVNEKTTGHSYAQSAEVGKKTATMSNSSNGSMGNGFSFGSGASGNTTSVARQAATSPAANVLFSELLEKAEFLKTQNGSKVLNLELDPKELGKIEMELTSRDGSVSARISAESALSKAKLDELAPQIKEQLQSQGVNLTEITVDISSKNPDEQHNSQMSGGKSKSSRISASEKEGAEAIIRKNILPHLRRAALNIQAVDMMV